MEPDMIDARVSTFISAMEKRDFMTKSQAMVQGFADALLQADARAGVHPKSKPSDILGMSAASDMNPWVIKGHGTTFWIDDLIAETKPTIKHLGRPKAKS